MKLILFFLFFFISKIYITAQQEYIYLDFDCPVDITKSSAKTMREIDPFIFNEYLIDSSKNTAIFFSATIDSTGRIWSAHIRKSENLKTDYYTTYQLCRALEENINIKYMVDYLAYLKSKGKPIIADKKGNLSIIIPYKIPSRL